ncbi:MAG TPA: class B sortase [Lachnospiraceae bacterium]|nr:class B sortase [Lachnospiraceae bacterium]
MKHRQKLFYLLLLIPVACAIWVVVYETQLNTNQKIYDKTREEAFSTVSEPAPESSVSTDSGTADASSEESASDSSEVTSEETISQQESPEALKAASHTEEIADSAANDIVATGSVNFAALQEECPDICAYISIEGTRIDYPIARSTTDDSYYLNHTIDGTAGYPGSIYIESRNSADFSDWNTVVYGHNMRSGSMFGTLSEFRDADYMNAHPYAVVYTPSATYIYTIFAAVTYNNRNIMTSFDFTKPNGRLSFLDSVNEARSISDPYRSDVTVNEDSHLLTLSTCTSESSDRLIVLAVLTGQQ